MTGAIIPNRHLPPSARPACQAGAPLLALLLAAAAPLRGAEAPADAVAAAGLGPDRHADAPTPVEAFGDWRLECAAGCRLATEVTGTDGAPALRLGVTVNADGPGALVIETPLPLYLPDPLELAPGPRAAVTLPWHTCGPAGCEVRTGLAPALLEGLRREREATVTFTLVDGVRVRLPVSLMGFTAGERALRQIAD